MPTVVRFAGDKLNKENTKAITPAPSEVEDNVAPSTTETAPTETVKTDAEDRPYPKPNKIDYGAYVDANKDVADWWSDARQQGMFGTGGAYSQAYGKDTTGYEKAWLDGMNKRYGTDNTDLGQFSKDQYGEYHYVTYGKGEERNNQYYSPTPEAPKEEPEEPKTPEEPVFETPVEEPEKPKSPMEDNIFDAKDRAKNYMANQTTINGDGNTVTNNQDNSVYYGGDNRQLNLNSGSGSSGSSSNSNGTPDWAKAADQAITMGTLGGFYSVDDSPSAQASFVAQQQQMMEDSRERNRGAGKRIADQYSGYKGGNVNLVNLQKSIDRMPQYFRDLGTIQEVKTFGDRAAKTNYPRFDFGAPLKPIESNTSDIADKYKDAIDDL